MSVAILSTIGTFLAGIAAVLLIPFLARRGSGLRAVVYGLIGAVFGFSFVRWITGLGGAAVYGTPHRGAMLLTGGLPVRAIDAVIFAAFLALAVAMTLRRRRA